MAFGLFKKSELVRMEQPDWLRGENVRLDSKSPNSRLHIGHTRLTHGYRLERPVPAQPFCDLCNRELTVEHILINCSSYDEQRAQSFEHCDSLAELFEKTPARIICGFIRDIGLFHEI